VFLTAADNTTNAMSTITHTETTKLKITVLTPLRGNVLRVELLIKKRAAFCKTQPRRREKIARFHSAPDMAHGSIGLTGIAVLVW
jgi:hypothetical protein